MSKALEWFKAAAEWLKVIYQYRGLILILLSGTGLFAQYQYADAEIKDTEKKANESISALVTHYVPESKTKVETRTIVKECDHSKINKRLDRLEREHY